MVDAKEMVRELGLEVIVPAAQEMLEIEESSINRPALQLTGFWKFFAYQRPQILGRGEMVFLSQLEPEERSKTLRQFFSYKMPCVIVCRGIPPTDEMIVLAKINKVPLYATREATNHLEVELLSYLNRALAPQETCHGVLVDVYGTGVLITGKSGVGKSEAALELIRRGHRLVADDVVVIRKLSESMLVGESPELVRNLMEIRGVGIIDVSVMYGIGSVISSKQIDLIIHLEMWEPKKEYDRLGNVMEYSEILGVQIPHILLPIQPGRDLGIVLEAAVSNFRLRLQGFSVVEELQRRQSRR